MSLIHRRCNARVASPDRSEQPNHQNHVLKIDSGDHMRSLRGDLPFTKGTSMANPVLGFIGLDLMGGNMVECLQSKGYL